MKVAKRFWVTALAICLSAFCSVVAEASAAFTTIAYPDAVSTFVYGINPAGDIVGAYVDTAGRRHGFVLRNGEFSDFDWPGSTWTEGWGINPQGEIVGQYGWFENGFNTIHGFLLRDGILSPMDAPGQPNTMLVKISPTGTIVGCYHVGTPTGATILDSMYGFIWNAEGVASHPTNRSMDNGVNPAGDVVGIYFSPANGRVEWSYLIRDGAITWFQFPGSVVTQAWDISPNGTIVGFHRVDMTAPAVFHGFVMEDGVMTSFDVPGATETRAYGVNARGDVVGYYRDATGTHGFLLSPRKAK